MTAIFTRVALAASFAVPLAFVAAPAAAQAVAGQSVSDAPVSISIEYGDIDIASAAGGARLMQRVEGGVKAACDRPYMRNLKAMRDYDQCIVSLREEAVEALARHGVSPAI